MFNKKRYLWIFVLMFVIPVSFGDSWDSWVLAGKNIDFDNVIFSTGVNSRWDTATIAFDSELFLIEVGSCEDSGLYRICFREAKFNLTQGYGYYNLTTEVRIPSLRIAISTLTPTVELTRTIDKTNFLVNDIATISVEVDNTGEKKIYSLDYRDTIPSQFTIVEMNGVTSSGNTIIWSWPNLIGERTFFYKIKLRTPVNISWRAGLNYVFGLKSFSKNTNNLTIKTIQASNPLVVTASLSDDDLKIGETTLYTININNTDKDRTISDAELVLVVPEKIKIKTYDEFNKEKNTLSLKGNLNPGEGKSFTALLKTDYTGVYDLNASVKNSFYSEVEKKTRTITKVYSKKLKTDFTKLEPSVKFMFDKKTIEYGDKSNVRAFIENKDSSIPLYDVKFEIMSKLFDVYSGNLEYILPGEKTEAFYYAFESPSLAKDTVYNVTFKGSYRTGYYEYFNFFASDLIKIKKDPNAVAEVQEEVEEPVVSEEVNESVEDKVEQDVEVEIVEPQPEEKGNIFVRFFMALARLLKRWF